MDHGTTSPDELRRQLSRTGRSAWAWAVVAPVADDPARLLAMRVLVGPKPDGWREQLWQYGQCTFVSRRVTCGRLATWLRGGTQPIDLDAVHTSIEIPDNFTFHSIHLPSLARYGSFSLPWPSTMYTLSFASTGTNPPEGYLVGAGDTPSFPAFGSAYSAFFFGDYAVSGVGNPQFDTTIHVVDGRARIRRVRIRPASLDIWLGGSALKATVLELNGQEHRVTVDVASTRVLIPLPDGLPSDAWIWLKSGSEWLDFRPLNQWGGVVSPDIEVELPRDPDAELARLATQGEGAQLEYKGKLPDTREQKRTVFKTVVAFANGAGGTLVFGIADETKEVTGIEGKPSVERRRLMDFARDLIRPAPRVQVDDGEVDGHHVLLLHVYPGEGTVHALVLDANKPEYYVRRDATTFFAHPHEIEAIVAQRGQAA